jgi:GNAT superfamily N-acetyltransferase
MLTISVEDHRPTAELDEEIARLGYTALQGWPDHTPVDTALVRSMLRPAGMTASTLVVQRDGDGAMVGFAAVRWPATLDEPGRFWGPVVSPEWRGRGVGQAIMQATVDLLGSHAGVRLRTTDIPESRAGGYLIFERAGWRLDARATLLERDLTHLPGELTGAASAVSVRTIRSGDYVAPQLAALAAVNHPELGMAAARDTFARWTADARYRPDGLLLAEAGDRLIGAAMVYATRPLAAEPPLTPRSAALRSVPGTPLCASQAGGLPGPRPRLGTSVDNEPNQALLAYLLTSPDLTSDARAAVRMALVVASLNAGKVAGAEFARAIVTDEDLATTLRDVGFRDLDRIRRYTWPPEGLGTPAGTVG